MSLNPGRGVEPGDAVPALANPTVVINLKTNNSWINLEVTSCCLAPTIQPDHTILHLLPFLQDPEVIVTSLRNRISFGPMLKEVKNSTFPENIDPSERDLVLVILSLAPLLSQGRCGSILP
ncbi:hypothetical protein VZT92_020708 [Zoarces viviparus]|uniref:Uncharacterized protein n=1 Tax=Zoarces viviparus TaxID=48416 RepID=A0AAW1EF91_ZOAVI